MASERFVQVSDRRRIFPIGRRPAVQTMLKEVAGDSLRRRLINPVPDCYSAGSGSERFNSDERGPTASDKWLPINRLATEHDET
jgi:hypothetical protein